MYLKRLAPCLDSYSFHQIHHQSLPQYYTIKIPRSLTFRILLPNTLVIKMITIKALVAAMAFASLARAETHTITAREDNSFDPDTLKAAEGDVVEFHFERGNHSVVAGNYDFPCSPMQLGEGFFSGFMDTDDDAAVSQERPRMPGHS